MSFTVVPVNDAPTAVNSTLTGIAEDAADASNTGTAVSTLVANSTDPDASPLKGMAIVGVDNSDGEWQYTLNGGSTWNTIITASDFAAILLAGNNANHKVRFVPDPNYFGTSTLTFRAWDQTSRTAGSVVAVGSSGGSTAFSANTASATLTITSAIDPFDMSLETDPKALSFNGSSDYLSSTLSPLDALDNFTLSFWFKPDVIDGTQDLVGQDDAVEVVLRTVSNVTTLDVYSAGPNRTDSVDITAVIGVGSWTHVIIVGDASRGTLKIYINDTLEYTITSAPTTHFGTSTAGMNVAGYVSDSANGNFFQGQIDNIAVWDSAYAGDAIDAIRNYVPGSSAANLRGFWSFDETTGDAVNALSGASSTTTLTLNGSTSRVTATALDTTSSYTEQASAIALKPLIGIFDLDYAVITATVQITAGFVPGDTLALTPDSSTMGDISVTAYNSSTGVLTLATSSGATPRQWVTALRAVTFVNSFSNNPGTSRTVGFLVAGASTSTTQLTMPLTIIPANDAPVVAATTLTSISEDVADTSNVGTSVFDMVAAITDVDSGANKGIAITAINTTDGRWQYTLNGGTTWVTMLNVSTTNAIPLAANLNHKVRFIPNPTFSGTTTFQFRAWDQTNGTAGQGINVSVNGGTTAFSANTATATLTVDNIVAGIYTSMSSNTKSLQFNGSSAYLSSSTSTLSALTNFTLSFWVNPDTLSGRQDLVGQRGALVVYLDTTAGTNLCVAASGTGRSTECISVTSYLLPNDWTHIAITGEAGRGSLKLFVDGTQRGVFSGSAHSTFGSSVNPMRVAGYVSDASNGNFFAGQIDEISLWNGVFNADTISALQWFHPTGNEPYLLGYWSLDEGSGSTAANALTGASSATHLTTSGSPLW
ncbi:MAG: LamG-like jellyroll fold domain-containing protein, partial [Roseiflexaceae bacterium]